MPGEFRKREVIGDKFVVTYTIDDSHDGFRADAFLKSLYTRQSRAQLQKAIDEGRVSSLTPTRRLKASTTLRAGDQIQVFTPKHDGEPIVDTRYKILFEDEHLIVVDKPGNLPVHPAGRFLFNTLVMAMRNDRPECVAPDEERDFYLIHRLDRETSGVIVLAKRRPIAKALIEQFFERQTEKHYWAVAQGEILDDEFEVVNDIGPAQGSEVRLKMQTFPQGTYLTKPDSGIQSAHTIFTVKKRANGKTLLSCELKTGRQHQIRVHLAHVGHPVVGDKLYGGREDLFLKYVESGSVMNDEMLDTLEIERHALHSRSLKFQHPVSGEWMEIESELPADMAELIS